MARPRIGVEAQVERGPTRGARLGVPRDEPLHGLDRRVAIALAVKELEALSGALGGEPVEHVCRGLVRRGVLEVAPGHAEQHEVFVVVRRECLSKRLDLERQEHPELPLGPRHDSLEREARKHAHGHALRPRYGGSGAGRSERPHPHLRTFAVPVGEDPRVRGDVRP